MSEKREKPGFFDLNQPFYRPLWLRVAIVVSCLVMTVLEFSRASPFWGVLFAGIGLYCFWGFFIAFNPADPEKPNDKKPE